MCTNPRRIFNPTKDFLYSDSHYLSVPCGECAECRYQKQSDWQFRAQEEMLNKKANGYRIYFITLTYRNDSLPVYRFDWQGSSKEVPCFSREDISNFTTDLRHALNNEFDCFASSFLICSEYGSHTQRPHYHMLLAVDSKISSVLLHALIKRLWTHGFVFPRRFDGGTDHNGYYHKPFEVSNILSSAFYTSKYVCKDLSYNDSFPHLVAHCKALHDKAKFDHSVDEEYKSCRRCFPFMRSSKGFGACINDKVSSVYDLLNGVSDVNNPEVLRQLPAYNMRKALYDVNYVDLNGKKCVRYSPKEIAHEYVKLRFDRQVYMLSEKLHDFIFNTERQPLIHDFCEHNNLDLFVFKSELVAKLRERSSEDLAVYKICFQDRFLPVVLDGFCSDPILDADNFCSYGDLDYYICRGFDYKYAHFGKVRGFNPSLNSDILKLNSNYKFNHFKVFDGFDDLLDAFEAYSCYYRSVQTNVRAFCDKQRSKVKQMFTEIDY